MGREVAPNFNSRFWGYKPLFSSHYYTDAHFTNQSCACLLLVIFQIIFSNVHRLITSGLSGTGKLVWCTLAERGALNSSPVMWDVNCGKNFVKMYVQIIETGCILEMRYPFMMVVCVCVNLQKFLEIYVELLCNLVKFDELRDGKMMLLLFTFKSLAEFSLLTLT